jgi:cell division protein FtsI (penicillin-binding protein 3)
VGIVLLWGGLILCKLISLQVIHHREYVQKAMNRQVESVDIQAPRGAILDRMGQPLAMSVPTESVSVDPRKVPSLELDSDLLARELHMDRPELYQRIKSARENHRGFLWVKRDLTAQEAEDLRSLKLDWIHIASGSQRHYPNGKLAAHVLGGVNYEETGNGGVEKALEPDLHGQPGKAQILTDVKRRGVDELTASQAHAGTTITLTIDERLQFVAEREIAAAVTAHDAVSGSVVVMNPYDGQILALASYPTYDPNQPPETEKDVAARSNHATSVPFEPGSVFKVITLSAALETTKLRPETPINCHGGVLTLFGRTIHDSHAGLGFLPMAEVLAHSSNIGAIEIGLQVGRDSMYDYVRRFGFGQKTGIPLPGESKGRLRPLTIWGSTSLASIAMGQEVSVTTLQLAQAAAVVANGGLLVKPRLVLKKGDQTPAPEPPVRAIRAETAITMRQMMEGVVLNGTGKAARLEGYTVGGKTGSAQIFDYATRHYTHTYNGSFMGIAPLTNPAVVVVVTLNGTHGIEGFGGAAAAPVFKAVTAEALRILDVPKDLPDQPALPELVAQNPRNEATDDLAIADLGSNQPNILEDRDDEDQVAESAQPSGRPAAAAPFVGPQPPEIKPAAGDPSEITVPNFKGMTLRAVLTEATARGIPVQPDGSGVARVQHPPAGAVLHQGERIRVQFAR